MATIKIKNKTFENIQIIICDKDGTLAEFDAMWGNWIKSWIDRLISRTVDRHEINMDALRDNLDRTLGFDRPNTSVFPESPVAVSTMEKIYTVAMTVLYQSGLPWHDGEELVAAVASEPLIMTDEMVQPLGDVKGAFTHWIDAGIKVIIATSDDREPAEDATKLMGIHELVTEYFCGNDPYPNKPNPEAIHIICEKYGVTPKQMLMVGDALSDIAFGRNGGLQGCIGIKGGSGNEGDLEKAADVVVGSVDQFEIIV